MRRVVVIMVVLLSLTACIRDRIPACPPMEVTLSVLDKNYSNISEFEEIGLKPRQENLPFKEYVGTVYYRLANPEDDSDVEIKGPFQVETEDGTLKLSFSPSVPHGTYELTVWGGLKDAACLSGNAGSLTLHQNGHGGEDVYLAHGTFQYDAMNNGGHLELERVKGHLLILTEGLSSDDLEIETKINGICASVDRNFDYQGSCSCSETGSLSMAGNTIGLNLAPSVQGKKAKLSVVYRDTDAEEYVPEDIYIELKRNAVTLVKYTYNPENKEFFIYLFVDGQWEKYHDMVID